MAWTVVSGNRMPVRLSGSDRKLLKEMEVKEKSRPSIWIIKV